MEAVGKVPARGGAEGVVVVLCAEEEVRDVIAYWLAPLPIRTER